MKNITKAIALCLALLLCLSIPVGVSAAEVGDATIDMSAKGSLTIYKVDLTNAEKDGVWDSSYVSTGVYDQNVYDALIGATRAGDTDDTSDLGNGEVSHGYAVKGVEFTYLRVADIVQFTESTADGVDFDHVEVLYGIDKTKGADLLSTLGLAAGAQRYENADNSDKLDSANYYYQSDVLVAALNTALETNVTTVKNALESYVAANGGTAMPLTDAYGKTQAENLDLGLYLLVETKVPEMVTSTCNPFFISLPMTSVNGTNATDGGTRWIYDVTIYPKNLTGIPSLEKTLRENKNDTGKNQGSTSSITDGYAHTGTASDGDIIDYQIVSTLPSITSESTYLTCYTFIDTLSKGITYNKNDVVLEFFTDAACTDLITTWKEADGKFTVAYSTTGDGESVMTIEMTARGLSEINTSNSAYTAAGMVNSGYSDCTVRITYAATMNSDASVVYGDDGNPNEVVLTWKRSSQDYYDTLVDDAHIYVYGLELTKLFSDGNGGCCLDFLDGQYMINILEPKVWASEPVEDPDAPEAFRRSGRISQHIAFLKDWFRSYKDFTDAEVDTIEIMLSQLYQNFGLTEKTDFSKLQPEDYPVLSDLYDLCIQEYHCYDAKRKPLYTEETLRNICLGLNSVCVGSESRFFNGHTNIQDNMFLVFGVKGVMDLNKKLRCAIEFNILSYMTHQLLSVGNCVAALDELYLFLDSPVTIEYIRNNMKRVRKKDSSMVLASQNIEDFLIPNIREMTKPLFSIPTHQFLFNPGQINPWDYMDALQVEQAEYDLIHSCERGHNLYRCGNERYLLQVIAPEHKAALFGNAGGR